MNIEFDDEALEELYLLGETNNKKYKKLPQTIIKKYIKVVNYMNKNELTPHWATHPGELIKDELRERKMTQKQLATQTGIKASIISETINGKRPVSLNVAVALEKALGIPVELWMNMQNQYNMDMANIAERRNRKETIKLTIPVADHNLLKELAHKFGWVGIL